MNAQPRRKKNTSSLIIISPFFVFSSLLGSSMSRSVQESTKSIGFDKLRDLRIRIPSIGIDRVD
ncbi:hypothetical protein SDJN02_26358 [Cucurbita argyrosperma subsp. argyrosperma]|nr:hypothetical protein SDJN02_26358 [Cucurbita argyrosperma subsp. argyrosperma]